MKQFLSILFLQLLLHSAQAGSIAEMQEPKIMGDTTIINEAIEDEAIEDVLKKRTPPPKEKVIYFSQEIGRAHV